MGIRLPGFQANSVGIKAPRPPAPYNGSFEDYLLKLKELPNQPSYNDPEIQRWLTMNNGLPISIARTYGLLQNVAPKIYAPNQYDMAGIEARAKGAGASAEQDYYANNPLPQLQAYLVNGGTAPTHVQAEIPNRVAPRENPIASAIAGIAGLIAPRFAGELNSAPLEASRAVANQQTEDAFRRYGLQQAQNEQNYQDALRQYQSDQSAMYHNAQAQALADQYNTGQKIARLNQLAPLAGIIAQSDVTQNETPALSEQTQEALRQATLFGLNRDSVNAQVNALETLAKLQSSIAGQLIPEQNKRFSVLGDLLLRNELRKAQNDRAQLASDTKLQLGEMDSSDRKAALNLRRQQIENTYKINKAKVDALIKKYENTNDGRLLASYAKQYEQDYITYRGVLWRMDDKKQVPEAEFTAATNALRASEANLIAQQEKMSAPNTQGDTSRGAKPVSQGTTKNSKAPVLSGQGYTLTPK